MARSGGGISGKNVRNVGVKTGKGNLRVDKGAVAQLGQRVGNHVNTGPRTKTNYKGENAGKNHSGMAMNPSTFGNKLALNVGKGGPGAGYVKYGQSGTQGQHGSVNPGQPMSPNQRSTDWSNAWPSSKK